MSGGAAADPVDFDAVLTVEVSAGGNPGKYRLLETAFSGVADASGGVVKFPAGSLDVAVPDVAGFGGTLVNGPGTFRRGGSGPVANCADSSARKVCIEGGTFGGEMALSGVTQAGDALPGWGLFHKGTVPVGRDASRQAVGAGWTAGVAYAWYFIPDRDLTPFRLDAAGTFRGLPSTFSGGGLPGFSLATPVVVHSSFGPSTADVRALARMRVDFVARRSDSSLGAVGLVAVVVAALALVGAGWSLRRAHQRAASPGQEPGPGVDEPT